MNIIPDKYLTKEELSSLSGAIAEIEKKTSGEIRVVIRSRRRWKERRMTLQELTLREFYKLGMEKTRDRTGILFLLLLSECKFQIVADEGINSRVEKGRWDKIATAMSGHFRNGNFHAGIYDALESVGAELVKHFPRKENDVNELPNEIIES